MEEDVKYYAKKQKDGGLSIPDNLGHLMLDLETMGTKSLTAPVMSIGAVEFDILTGRTGREFYIVIDLQSVFDLGIMPQANTIMWWMQQDDDARKKITEAKGVNISQAIHEFTLFIQELKPKNLQVWGNSNRFDLGALEIIYNKLKKEIPWKYSLERDVRTLVSFAPDIKKNMPFNGIKHNPIDDCKHQINYCTEIYKKITQNRDERRVNYINSEDAINLTKDELKEQVKLLFSKYKESEFTETEIDYFIDYKFS